MATGDNDINIGYGEKSVAAISTWRRWQQLSMAKRNVIKINVARGIRKKQRQRKSRKAAAHQ